MLAINGLARVAIEVNVPRIYLCQVRISLLSLALEPGGDITRSPVSMSIEIVLLAIKNKCIKTINLFTYFFVQVYLLYIPTHLHILIHNTTTHIQGQR